jgi:hypothetical protein
MIRPFLITALLAFVMVPASAQVNNEKYRGMLLVGEFGELCTMCEAIVLCEATTDPRTLKDVPTTGSFTLYHLQTRTFWSQISTIWEWFIANFDSESLAQGHSRPADIYQVQEGIWNKPSTVEAHLALEPPVINFSAHSVNRVNNQWIRTVDNKPAGYCQRMPLWESLDMISTKTVDEQQWAL